MENSDYNNAVVGTIGDGWSQTGGGGGAGGSTGGSAPVDTTSYRTIIVNQQSGGQTIIQNSDSPNHTLTFTLEVNKSTPTNSTVVSIDADVYTGNAIKYIYTSTI